MSTHSKQLHLSGTTPIDIQEVIHTSANPHPLHHHAQKEILFIVGGKGTLELSECAFPLVKGDLIILNEGEPHRILDEENTLLSLFLIVYWESIWNEIDNKDRLSSFTASIEPARRVLSTVRTPALSPIPYLLRDMLREKEAGMPFGYALLKAKLMEILILLASFFLHEDKSASEGMGTSEEHVRRVLRFLHTTYSDNWTRNHAADMAGLSIRRFSALFKEETGMTFHDYLLSLRIGKAKEMFNAGTANIAHVCFEAGFNDLSTFYRAFKKVTGDTPKHYIACVNKEPPRADTTETT